jgi:hypothetical protein
VVASASEGSGERKTVKIPRPKAAPAKPRSGSSRSAVTPLATLASRSSATRACSASAIMPQSGGISRFESGINDITHEISVIVNPRAEKCSGRNGNSAPSAPKLRK